MRRLFTVLLLALGVILGSACSPQQALHYLRDAQPNGKYSPPACTHRSDPPSVHPNRQYAWNCSPLVVAEINQFSRLATAYWSGHARRQALVARWSGVADCESGGNWAINTGNGYYGGLQFNLGTWASFGGRGMPHHQPAWYQAEVADRVRTQSGLHHWPHCGRYYG